MKKLIGIALVIAVIGCEDQTKKSPNSIVGKTTQNIGEYDAKAGANVSDSKIRATDPITAPVMAYGPMLARQRPAWAEARC